MLDNEFKKIDNLVIYVTTKLGTTLIYTTGVNLSKENKYHTPIFVGTVIVSFISTVLLRESTTYIIKKIKSKNRNDYNGITNDKVYTRDNER